MNEITKAEKLADEIDLAWLENVDIGIDEIQNELRRLSPMEAERDKLVEVNKILVEALETATFWTQESYDKAQEAIKLSGEIK